MGDTLSIVALATGTQVTLAQIGEVAVLSVIVYIVHMSIRSVTIKMSLLVLALVAALLLILILGTVNGTLR